MLQLVSVVKPRLGHVLAMVWMGQDRAEPWLGLRSPGWAVSGSQRRCPTRLAQWGTPWAYVLSRVSPPLRFSFLSSLPSLAAPVGLPVSSSFSFGWDGLTHLSDRENQEELKFGQD